MQKSMGPFQLSASESASKHAQGIRMHVDCHVSCAEGSLFTSQFFRLYENLHARFLSCRFPLELPPA
jgi:hypothetical protein